MIARLLRYYGAYAFLLGLGCLQLHAAPNLLTPEPEPLVLSASQSGQTFNGHMSWLIDPRGTLRVEDVATRDHQSGLPILTKPASFGLSSAVYWLKIRLDPRDYSGKTRTLTTEPNTNDWWLEIPFSWVDDIRIYHQRWDYPEEYDVTYLGDHYPASAREIPNRYFIAPLKLPDDRISTLYIRVQSSSAVNLPLIIWRPIPLTNAIQQDTSLQTLYYGMILFLLMYSLFMRISTGTTLFGDYAIMVIASFFTLIAVNGHASQYLWSNWSWMADHQLEIFPPLWGFFGTRFVQHILNIDPATRPRLHRASVGVQILCLVGAVVGILGDVKTGILLVEPILFAAISIGLTTAGIYTLQRNRIASLILIGYLFLLVGMLGVSLRNLGIFQFEVITNNFIQIGMVLENVLLALALALRTQKSQLAGESALRQAVSEQQHQLADLQHTEHALADQLQASKQSEAILQNTLSQLKLSSDSIEIRLKENETLVKTLAYSDVLTGLPNRAYLADLIERWCDPSKSDAPPFALVLLDLDAFRTYNIQHGHPQGDILLTHIAQLASNQAEMIRMGGDEFIVLLPAATPARVDIWIANYQLFCRHTLPNKRPGISFCAGIAYAPQDGTTLLTLLVAAADALNQAKQQGTGRVVWHQRPLPLESSPA